MMPLDLQAASKTDQNLYHTGAFSRMVGITGSAKFDFLTERPRPSNATMIRNLEAHRRSD